MKILVVDDDKQITDMLKEALAQYEVDTALEGKTGLELIKQGDYDIAFLDENMPELTGLEIIAYVKANNIKTKTVILTGYNEITEEFSKTIGADEFLMKPVNLDIINGIIDKYSEKK